ncbi:hypothetical protein Z968_11410 [Clostridium novyi A str. 4552]|uniref:Transglutaminase-like domain-containing protein n=1 Tax=Clostridium novyi A str. 4552 TaxID=1444289 RepID=A0A0A0I1P0_CLONO|nr:transglutaminase domain-containing protein [Clostridium novyi]KGM94588.1 hypothetical protein Z968_11410 [Clostridium novyi A str. 4552]
MKRGRKLIRCLLVLLIAGFVIGINLKMQKLSVKNNLTILKWDNLYTDKNINLYYGTSELPILNELNSKYKLKEIVGGEKEKLNKALNIMKWVKANMEYDKSKKNKIENKGAADILSGKKKSKQYSNLEICTVFNEFCNSENIMCRIGKYTVLAEEKLKKENPDLFVCEIWDEKYNKWIMIDVINGTYVKEKDNPVSAIEVIDKGIYNLNIVGEEKAAKYQKKMSKYFSNYTIKIDNTVYNVKKSNCYITYLGKSSNNQLSIKNPLEYPSIYTKDKHLFEVEPNKEIQSYNTNEKPTIIFSKVNISKKSKKDKQDENVKMELCVGVFKNSSMEDKYYISINDSPFEQKNKYFNVKIKEGITNIKLSEDGKNVVREVGLEYKK